MSAPELESIRKAVQRYQVAPGAPAELDRRDPADKTAFGGDKKAGEVLAEQLSDRIGELQDILYAQSTHRLLIVLQALDTGGKDGTIRHVFRAVDPIGVTVTSFKQPTAPELAHDYLWRVHPRVPGDGEIAVFNRSHYEDVLVVRVLGLVEPARLERRYDHINAFERMLTDEGTTIVKFFLHLSRDEQRERLLARLEDPTKRWKFARGDLDTRAKWGDYATAYDEALSRTSTTSAPWYVVPADRKWYRNLVVAAVLVNVLEGMDLRYPEPEDDLDGIVIPE